ncbi:hypothetical protein [Parapedobacter sp. 10938]|uniref:hypothetical protein n=1 Tax=Parapedobacter flavus TaxID=3110225 RepID=UPI002DBE8E3D|nr:hypothetical protein [Parapedobacter sp. 10938]MEC3881508.1 hypothetical protein [Parapedobacter sp. 10938]
MERFTTFSSARPTIGLPIVKTRINNQKVTAIKLLIATMICLMFSGCSFLSELFIQNRSNESLSITITYKVPAAEFAAKASQMDYVPRICNPKQYRKDDRRTSIKITHRSDSSVSFFIPPQSTARIESASNRDFMKHIRQISYDESHFSAESFLAASKKRQFSYTHRVN